MRARVVTLDVREDIRAGRPPCARILAAVAALGPGETLRLLVPFEPVPLYELLGQQGFTHATHPLPGGDFEVLFSPGNGAPVRAPVGPTDSRCPARQGHAGSARNLRELDLRGLVPPVPFTRILEATVRLLPEESLVAYTDRRPRPLYAELARRGLEVQTERLPDGSFRTVIRRGRSQCSAVAHDP